MCAPFFITRLGRRGIFILGLLIALGGDLAQAQASTSTVDTPANAWQHYSWLGAEAKPDSGTSVTVHTGQDLHDANAVITTGSLWQEKCDAIYSRRLADGLSLSYETNGTMLNESVDAFGPMADDSSDTLARGQNIGLEVQPVQALTLRGNFHESTTEAARLGDGTFTNGAGFSAESRLPFNSTLSFSLNSDESGNDAPSGSLTSHNAYHAELHQPLGQTPFTAVIKGHYEETSDEGSLISRTPSLEQLLVWKPMQETTVQAGLRQQQYQEYPGVDNKFNQALFADWSQQLGNNISWHSYAEVLNSRGLIDQAPGAPIASGANGTAQATIPGSNTSLTSTLPISTEDQTLTFSTGPSFMLQKDISASFEYSNRWDKNPAVGAIGQEQRVSVSLKGTF